MPFFSNWKLHDPTKKGDCDVTRVNRSNDCFLKKMFCLLSSTSSSSSLYVRHIFVARVLSNLIFTVGLFSN